MDSGCRAERRLLTQLQLSVGPKSGFEASDRPRRPRQQAAHILAQRLHRSPGPGTSARLSPVAASEWRVSGQTGRQNPEMQLRQRHGADCYLSLDLTGIWSQEDTRVELSLIHISEPTRQAEISY